MKFSCERCGKKYATAENPVAGRVYKLRCKACGHVIVVKGATGAGPAAAAPAPRRIDAAPPTPASTAPATPPPAAAAPEVELEVPAPEPAAPRVADGAEEMPQPQPAPPPLRRHADATTEVSVPAPFAPPSPADEFSPPPGDTGFVDLFADTGTGATPMGAPAEPPALADDPFADVRAELARAEAAAEPRPPPVAATKVPDIPKPPSRKQGAPIALIAGGSAVLLAILAFTLVRSGTSETPMREAPVPVARATAPAPPPPKAAPAPEPIAATPAPDPVPPAKEEPPRREERRRRERDRRTPEPEPAQVTAEPQAPPPERPAVALPQEAAGIGPEQVNKVLAAAKGSFEACIASATAATEVKLDGRQVMLRLNVQPNGAVTYPTLDDVTLNGTEVGKCLKNAARMMVFPKFQGDTMHIEVPLVLGR